MKPIKILNVLVLIVCILIIGIMSFFLGLGLRNTAVVSNTNTSNTNVANTNNTSLTNAQVNTNTNTNVTVVTEDITAVTDAGVTWSTPEELDDLGLFTAKDSDLGPVTYFKVGSTEAGEDIILAEVTWNMPSPGGLARLVKDKTGRYSILSKLSEAETVSHVSSEVSVNDTRSFDSLNYPQTMSLKGIDMLVHPLVFGGDNTLFSQFKATDTEDRTLTTLGQSPYGEVLTMVTALIAPNADSHGILNSKNYVLVLNDGTMMRYIDDKDFLSDDGSLKATLNSAYTDFSSRTYQVGIVSDGCGHPIGDQTVEGLSVLNGQAPSSLTKIGTTPGGDNLYTVTDSTAPVIKEAYDAYNVGRGTETDASISFADFVAQQPLVLWQDQQGDFEVFMNTYYSALAECGKPVVYLYPTTPTTVSVQVGAQITVSDPVYQAGWTVLAQPNGQLTTADGQTYDSLFWEGKGLGQYPAITQGRVVARVNIESELRYDLLAQGLNAKESQDFLNFWLPRMPQTPFIRLTWIGTQGMNHLAPLTVHPTPDSTLRVFLDFAGQQTTSTTLAPQTLHTTARTGFTLVEWGGLLTSK